MERDEYVSMYGGKAGLHKYLRDTGKFSRHLLPTIYILPGGDIGKALKDWDFRRPSILRASHRCDLAGLVDVLMTTAGITDLEAMKESARSARKHAASAAVNRYARSESDGYDKKVTLMVQPELRTKRDPRKHGPVPYRGSVVEHPNRKGFYYVSVVSKQHISADIYEAMLVSDYDITEYKRLVRRGGYSPYDRLLRFASESVDLYRQIASVLGYSDISLQMEFGVNEPFKSLDKIIFHQARFFKRYENPSFNVKGHDPGCRVFGHTPESGLQLLVVRTRDITDIPRNSEPFIWIPDWISQSHRLGLTAVSENMKAFATEGRMHVVSLEHNLFRFVQKAQVGLISSNASLQHGDRIRLTADGRNYDIKHV